MSAPSIDSCTTLLTRLICACARSTGSSIRRANVRFISISVGMTARPIAARYGSVTTSEMTANSTRKITPVANGTGKKTSTAAFTSASMWASSSPVGCSRW